MPDRIRFIKVYTPPSLLSLLSSPPTLAPTSRLLTAYPHNPIPARSAMSSDSITTTTQVSAPVPSKRGRKRDDNLPPNRARDVQRAFRARRASHLEALEARVVVLEEENARFRALLDLPASDRPPLGTGPTGRGKLTCYISPPPGSIKDVPGSSRSSSSPSNSPLTANQHLHFQQPQGNSAGSAPSNNPNSIDALILSAVNNGTTSRPNNSQITSSSSSPPTSNTAASAASILEQRFGSSSPPSSNSMNTNLTSGPVVTTTMSNNKSSNWIQAPPNTTNNSFNWDQAQHNPMVPRTLQHPQQQQQYHHSYNNNSSAYGQPDHMMQGELLIQFSQRFRFRAHGRARLIAINLSSHCSSSDVVFRRSQFFMPLCVPWFQISHLLRQNYYRGPPLPDYPTPPPAIPHPISPFRPSNLRSRLIRILILTMIYRPTLPSTKPAHRLLNQRTAFTTRTSPPT